MPYSRTTYGATVSAAQLNNAEAGLETTTLIAEAAAVKPAAAAGVYFVDPVAGSDANDGKSWGGAKATIAAAVTACTASGGTVRLSAGVHSVSSAVSIPNFVSVKGEGESSIVRCTGNHYAFNFNPGNRVSIDSLQIDKSGAAQTSGGAFDFTNARNNIRIDSIYLGSGLHTGFNIKPNATSGHFYISRVKWNGSTGGVNGILIGDGTNLVAHVILRELLCVPATAADMTNFMVVKNNVDTLKADCVELYGATNGILIGENAANDVTDSFFSRTLIDMVTNTGLDVAKCRGFAWTDGQIQTCATGLNVGTLAKGAKFRGGRVQNCSGDGVTVQSGARYIEFDWDVNDNNTSNGAFGQGYDIVGGASHVKIRGRVGNGILLGSTGHQKYGILVSAGASDYLDIDATFLGNETAPTDLSAATGANNRVRGQGLQTPTVASAATVTLPGSEVVKISGTTTITSITASWAGRRVTLIFTGALTLTDGSNLKLAGNFVTAADDAITLVCDGTNWHEANRAGIPATIVDAKGDLIAATAADTVARLAVGTDNQVLRASSGASTGLAWVDDVAASLTVRTASTANVTIPPGGTSLSLGGVTVANDDLVLLKDQTTAAQNGVYVVGGVGSSVTLTRAAELDVSAEFAPGLIVFVRDGNHRGTSWQLINTALNPTVGTTAIYWTRIAPSYLVASDMGNQLAFFTGIMESHSGHLVNGTITSGTVRVQPLGVLRAGHTITSVRFTSGSTAATSPTNQWAGVCNASRVIKGISADKTTEAWGTFADKTFALGSAYTAPFDEMLYSFINVTAPTPPSFCVFNRMSASRSAAGNSNTGQTTPLSNGATLNALTAHADNIYCLAA